MNTTSPEEKKEGASTIELHHEVLMQWIEEVLDSNPIDYGDLPWDEKEVRSNCADLSLLMIDQFQKGTPEDRLYGLMSAMAVLLEENLVLKAQQLKAAGYDWKSIEKALGRGDSSAVEE